MARLCFSAAPSRRPIVNSAQTGGHVPPACNFPIRKFRISSYGQFVVDAVVRKRYGQGAAKA